MKRMILVVAVLSLVSGLALAQTTEVSSVNVVGYIKVTVPSNGLAFVTVPLETLNGSVFTIPSIISNQLPGGSMAYIWDRNSKSYQIESMGRSGWLPGTNRLYRGDGFWLKGVATTSDYTVTVMGEVPDSILEMTTTVNNISSVDAAGYAYPADVLWTNTTLAKGANSADMIYIWNSTNQTYSIYSIGRSGWNTPADYKIRAGQAFWYRRGGGGPTNWIETVPYNLH